VQFFFIGSVERIAGKGPLKACAGFTPSSLPPENVCQVAFGLGIVREKAPGNFKLRQGTGEVALDSVETEGAREVRFAQPQAIYQAIPAQRPPA
jgi:hypothetical protein